MTIGYVFKAEFYLPENASNFLNGLSDPFDVSTQPITGAKRRRSIGESSELTTEVPTNALDEYSGFDEEQNERYEKHQIEAEVVDSGTEAPTDSDDYDEERSWFEDDHFDKSNDPFALKAPQNLGTTRWTIYKGMAAIAQKFAF